MYSTHRGKCVKWHDNSDIRYQSIPYKSAKNHAFMVHGHKSIDQTKPGKKKDLVKFQKI